MKRRERRHPHEEFERRGKDIYERVVKPTLTNADLGKFLAIDIESEAYEIDADSMTATKRLYQRCPDAQPTVLRIGYPAAEKLGGAWPAGSGESL